MNALCSVMIIAVWIQTAITGDLACGEIAVHISHVQYPYPKFEGRVVEKEEVRAEKRAET